MSGLTLLMLATLVYGWFNVGTVRTPPSVGVWWRAHPLPLAVIGGAPLLPCPPLYDLSRSPHPLMERMTHHGPPLLLGKDDSSRTPHPSLERVTHHFPLSPPLGACYRLLQPLPFVPPPPEKDDSSLDD